MRHLTLALVLLLGCAPESEEDIALDDSEQPLVNAGPGLATATRSTLASMTGAENQLFTSNDRLLISGDQGIFELAKSGTTITFGTLIGAQSCQFGGLAEAKGFVYANCYGLSDSLLFAAKLQPKGTPLSFASIGSIGRALANGLTADAQGRLHVTTTFSDLILRLTPNATGTAIAARDTYQQRAGSLANGIDYFNGNVFWTDSVNIKRNGVAAPSATPATLVTAAVYFDDLHVGETGILVADFTGGVLRAYDNAGKQTGVSPNAFNGPSSVDRANGRAGFSDGALIVTERNANRVSLFEPR